MGKKKKDREVRGCDRKRPSIRRVAQEIEWKKIKEGAEDKRTRETLFLKSRNRADCTFHF